MHFFVFFKGLRCYREASEDFVQVLKLDKKNLAAKNELTEVLNLLKKVGSLDILEPETKYHYVDISVAVLDIGKKRGKQKKRCSYKKKNINSRYRRRPRYTCINKNVLE